MNLKKKSYQDSQILVCKKEATLIKVVRHTTIKRILRIIAVTSPMENVFFSVNAL